MTTLSSSDLAAPVAAPPSPPGRSRPLLWSVRRELWENRSIYIGPLVGAGVVMVGFLVSLMFFVGKMRALAALDVARQEDMLAEPYHFVAMAVMVTAFIVAVFYCLGALQGERRDRSILFWKSLPVSDLTTVAAKALVPLVVIPAVVLVVVVATHVIMLLVSTGVLLAAGLSPVALWTEVPIFNTWLVLIYGLVVLSLWHAPLWGWLLLVSGWARRSSFLWAFLPPLALCVVERIAFHTSYFASLLAHRLGGFSEAFTTASGRWRGDGALTPNPVGFLSEPGLWLGLIVAGAFFAAAVWRRRRADPI